METPHNTQQDTVGGEHMNDQQPVGGEAIIPEGSWADYLLQKKPLSMSMEEQEGERHIVSSIQYQSVPKTPRVRTTLLAIDPGKFSNKLLGVRQELGTDGIERPALVSINEPVAYRKAESSTYASGDKPLAYHLLQKHNVPEKGEWFHFGMDGLGGESIAVYDEFHQRWNNRRYQGVWYASIAKGLQAMGLSPVLKDDVRDIEQIEPYYLSLCVTLPDQEITDENGNTTLKPETRTAIEQTKGIFIVEMKDQKGLTWIWKVNVIKVLLLAQTMAAWVAIFNDLAGNPTPIIAQDTDGTPIIVDGNVVIDEWGGGDRQRGKFEIVNKGIIMRAEKIDEGTHEVAQALIRDVKKKYKVTLNLAQAQVALFKPVIDVSGSKQDITPLINDLRRSRIEKMISSATVDNEVRTKFWIHLGGGVALLGEEIKEYIRASGFEPWQFLVVDKEIAPLMVVLGAYAWQYVKLQTQLRELNQKEAIVTQQKEALLQRLQAARALTQGSSNASHVTLLTDIQSLLNDVESTPAFVGYEKDLTEFEQELRQIYADHPWLRQQTSRTNSK